MVFVLSWISLNRTNTIRNLSIYLSIYLGDQRDQQVRQRGVHPLHLPAGQAVGPALLQEHGGPGLVVPHEHQGDNHSFMFEIVLISESLTEIHTYTGFTVLK